MQKIRLAPRQCRILEDFVFLNKDKIEKGVWNRNRIILEVEKQHSLLVTLAHVSIAAKVMGVKLLVGGTRPEYKRELLQWQRVARELALEIVQLREELGSVEISDRLKSIIGGVYSKEEESHSVEEDNSEGRN